MATWLGLEQLRASIDQLTGTSKTVGGLYHIAAEIRDELGKTNPVLARQFYDDFLKISKPAVANRGIRPIIQRSDIPELAKQVVQNQGNPRTAAVQTVQAVIGNGTRTRSTALKVNETLLEEMNKAAPGKVTENAELINRGAADQKLVFSKVNTTTMVGVGFGILGWLFDRGEKKDPNTGQETGKKNGWLSVRGMIKLAMLSGAAYFTYQGMNRNNVIGKWTGLVAEPKAATVKVPSL